MSRESSAPDIQTTLPPAPDDNTPAAYFQAGLRLLQVGQLQAAEQCGRQALALDAHHADSLHLMGLLSLLAKQHAIAIEWFAEAIRQNPGVADYFFNLASALRQQGRVDEAISLLENGPPQWRSVPYVRFWLALSYALAGRKEQAAAEFTAFRAVAPKYTLAIERQLNVGSLTQEFLNQIVALSGEYGIPEK